MWWSVDPAVTTLPNSWESKRQGKEKQEKQHQQWGPFVLEFTT
jgi:hypothetical protein